MSKSLAKLGFKFVCKCNKFFLLAYLFSFILIISCVIKKGTNSFIARLKRTYKKECFKKLNLAKELKS